MELVTGSGADGNGVQVERRAAGADADSVKINAGHVGVARILPHDEIIRAIRCHGGMLFAARAGTEQRGIGVGDVAAGAQERAVNIEA